MKSLQSSFKIICISITLLFCMSTVHAQVSLSLTITDNIIKKAFGFDAPKPAAAKSNFKLINDKGTQVLFYFNATGTGELDEKGFRLRLIAYKTDSGTDEWNNELTYLLKKNDKSGIVAMNFFKPGTYKIEISDHADKTKILSTGIFTVDKTD
ncbi:MAG: hypothetical protein NT126_11425 [Bacteroidetes bacterium]|nr:hypothetical protein [Bacteroidota bacterium]